MSRTRVNARFSPPPPPSSPLPPPPLPTLTTTTAVLANSTDPSPLDIRGRRGITDAESDASILATTTSTNVEKNLPYPGYESLQEGIPLEPSIPYQNGLARMSAYMKRMLTIINLQEGRGGEGRGEEGRGGMVQYPDSPPYDFTVIYGRICQTNRGRSTTHMVALELKRQVNMTSLTLLL